MEKLLDVMLDLFSHSPLTCFCTYWWWWWWGIQALLIAC